MFKLMIVDDEPTIRLGLSSFIPWDTLDIQLIEQAHDGKQALQLIDDNQPDIIITDIKMPVMDGLELSRTLSNKYPHIKIIILTGYGDLSYAQSAIHYGVTDFILKPASKDKIISAVKRAQERIIMENHNICKLNDDIAILREQILEQFTRGLADEHKTKEYLQSHNLSLNNYFLTAFQLSECSMEHRRSNILTLKNKIAILNEDGYTFFFDNCLVLSVFKIDNTENNSCNETLNYCKQIYHKVENEFSESHLVVAISQLHNGFSELPKAAQEVIQTLSQQFFNEEDFMQYNNTWGEDSPLTVDRALFLCNLESMLENYDFVSTTQQIKNFFLEQRVSVANFNDTINTCEQIYLICTRVLSRHGRDSLQIDYQKKITTSVGLTKLETLILEMLNCTQQNLRKGVEKGNPLVSAVLDYINKNYANHLSLNEIAEMIHINPQHLCRLFKKVQGETINEYITKRRIEEAKRLLSTGDCLAYEVAEKVGFNDAAYFSLIFKKVTGVSPKYYK